MGSHGNISFYFEKSFEGLVPSSYLHLKQNKGPKTNFFFSFFFSSQLLGL
jgi:hypothetical protein